MADIASLCVFCGSATGADPRHAAAARALGAALGARGMRLIYGGGHVGLMGVLADAVLAAGGEVVGVIPEHLLRREVAHTGLSELVVVESMHARKAAMFARADAFAVLPGGIGTLDETIEILTWKQLGLHGKPIVLIDQDGYWRPLLALIEAAIAAGFAAPGLGGLYAVAPGIEALFAALEAAPAQAAAGDPSRL